MKKLLKNKKGQVGEGTQELVGTIIIALILIMTFVFSLIFGLPNLNTEKIKNTIGNEISEHYFVASRLYDRVNFNGQEIYFVDLVKISTIDENSNAKTILEIHGLEINEFYGFYIPIEEDKIYVGKNVKE